MRHTDKVCRTLFLRSQFQKLQDDYILRLRTFIALGNRELYALTILQRSVALAADGPKVHEDVFTLLSLDEAVSFTVIKPLDGAGFALCHLYHPRIAS